MTRRSLAILVFDDVEVLDFCGPFEVFSVANRFTDRPAFEVLTVTEGSGPISTTGGLSVNPHRRMTDCPQPDLLLVPGGQGARREMNNPAIVSWVREAASNAILTMSVCTGALILGKAGLLDGLRTTTHHGAIDLLRETVPTAIVHPDRRFVENERIICSAGIAAGIDMSLYVVGKLLGKDVAAKTARHMEYPWPGGDDTPVETACDLDTAVPEWVIEHPEILAVFRDLGIDSSCGGKSLAYACRQQGLDAEAVLSKLRGCLDAKRRGSSPQG